MFHANGFDIQRYPIKRKKRSHEMISLQLKHIAIEIRDTYQTVAQTSGNVIYKDRGSKFIGYVFPVSREEAINQHLNELKKEHHAARHWCYAWRLGKEEPRFRAHDDGEPSNSAGQPIYGQLLAHDLTEVLLVVVRYFGGTKLGVGGLIQAYRNTAKLTLEEAVIEERKIMMRLRIKFEYRFMDKIRRIIREEKIDLEQEELGLDCTYILGIRKRDFEKVKKRFEELRCLTECLRV
jgi:uncharacterized YigZ family protein